MCNKLMCPIVLLWALVPAIPVLGQLPAGWTSLDIGGPAAAGSARYDQATETWTIQGDGTGIRGRADQFQFVYRTLTGNGELVARVAGIDPPLADWSMAGVMIRVMLTPGSPFIFMGLSANTEARNHGITLWGRTTFDAVAEDESAGVVAPPYWVKIQRTGDTFSGHVSPDGKEWTQWYTTSAPGIPPSIYIGYAVTSEVGGKLVTAAFDRGPVTASNPSPADRFPYALWPVVSWTAGVNAAFHDVYFGTGPTLTAEDYQGRQAGDSLMYHYAPGLIPGATYYWRIDEVAADGTTVYPGEVWSFTAAPATAYAPRPWDGREGVAVETDLAWTAGMNAIAHDIYFGADRTAVMAGDTGTFRGKVTERTWDPGTLAENTTYYWRIDEHDLAGLVHPGPVWSFKTVGPGIGVRAQYFRGMELAGSPVLTRIENAIDHDWGNGEVAAGLSDSVSARWTADLKAPFTETYRLITTSDDGVRLWLDDRRIIDNWTDHGATDDVATVHLVAGQFYRLRMEWYENTGGAVARLSWQSPSIARQIIPAGVLLLPGRATNPYPANASDDAPHAPLLRWTTDEAASHHDVYFGTDAQAVAEAGTATAGLYMGRQSAASVTFDPGELEWNQTYFWRVDEVNAASGGLWQGAVWRFTTADFLVIDDFESYTSDDGNRIYQTWIDGETNKTGSLVGYMEAVDGTFGERTIVHQGSQSMPLTYDNTQSPFYSEAERQFPTAQDWTVRGVDTLVLHVQGKTGNAPGPLYLRLQDSAGKDGTVAHSDPAIAQTVKWTRWEIPLSQFTAAGVNVARVREIRIGVGNRAQPVAGGAGTIFLDDIRVIK
jgi:hypothetical protein